VCLDLDKTYPVKMIVRIDKRGLSSAVIDGISQAKGKYIVVMDGDLSHPASAIPSMIKKIDTPLQVDFKELSGEIIRLMGNDNLRHFYANNLNMRVIKYFNIDRYVSELHGLYRSLL
jgi:glycosyltransferase involved in cell wall biosynthesis